MSKRLSRSGRSAGRLPAIRVYPSPKALDWLRDNAQVTVKDEIAEQDAEAAKKEAEKKPAKKTAAKKSQLRRKQKNPRQMQTKQTKKTLSKENLLR